MSRFLAYVALGKLRLSLLVVFSAVMAYLIAKPEAAQWREVLWLFLGGLFVTVSANALNQLFERQYDALMARTANRPLPTGKLRGVDALLFSLVFGVVGVYTLYHQYGALAGSLALLSLLLYALVYTPMKRVSVAAVFVGAIPGALPLLIGWVAATGSLEAGAWLLFGVQVVWQFPHFWSIAWLADADYRRAGYQLLPIMGGHTPRNAWLIFLSTLPVLLIPPWAWVLGYLDTSLAGWLLAGGLLAVSLWFLYKAWRLWRAQSMASARGLMFGSFLYLPLVLVILYLGALLL